MTKKYTSITIHTSLSATRIVVCINISMFQMNEVRYLCLHQKWTKHKFLSSHSQKNGHTVWSLQNYHRTYRWISNPLKLETSPIIAKWYLHYLLGKLNYQSIYVIRAYLKQSSLTKHKIATILVATVNSKWHVYRFSLNAMFISVTYTDASRIYDILIRCIKYYFHAPADCLKKNVQEAEI